MARRIRDKDIETREARRKLKVSGVPHWKAIGRGLHLGYRKGKTTGVWVLRRYQDGAYTVKNIATADDHEDANGVEILDFWQAQEVARNERQPEVRRVAAAGAYTVADAVRDYLRHAEGRPTYRDTLSRLNAFVLPALGDRAVASLTADDLRDWHRDIAKLPARVRTAPGKPQAYKDTDERDPEAIRRRQSSANMVLALLRAVLNHAWHEGKVELGDWPRVKAFKGVAVARTRFLTIAEAQRLINAAEGDFRVLVRAALATGARYQELARLQVSDFNPDAGTLHIRRSKTDKDRHIILTDEGARFFSGIAAGRSGDALLLGRDWGPSEQQGPMAAACKRAGITGASFHTLRHTWASLTIMAGAPPMVVAKNLGHVNTRMIELHYGHLAPSFIADAIRNGAPRFGEIEGDNKVKRIA